MDKPKEDILMKIGILTFHAASNFGANLQAYSSFLIYSKLGHTPKIINYIRPGDLNYINTVNARQYYAHKEFCREYLPLTAEIYSPEQLSQAIEEEGFDLISIGADAVWRAPKDDNDLVFFADWMFKKKVHPPVVAMSAAHMGCGFKNIPHNLSVRLKDCLEKFSFIAVRDEWTRKKINDDIFASDFVKNINPDPVIWLSDFVNNNDFPLYAELIARPYYLMTLPVRCDSDNRYKKWFAKFKSYVNNAGFSLVELPLPEGISGLNFDYTIKYPINPIHWFCYIKHARAFCGLRFHAIMSAISSNTPFFSIDSYGNSSLLMRIIRKAGLYKIGRALDNNSKIRNLLMNSGFENFRISGSITSISPHRVFEMLESFDRNKLLIFRNSLRVTYMRNLDSMFKSLAYEN